MSTNPSVNIGFGILGTFVVIGTGIALYAKFGPTDSPAAPPAAVGGGKRHSRRKHRSGRRTRKH